MAMPSARHSASTGTQHDSTPATRTSAEICWSCTGGCTVLHALLSHPPSCSSKDETFNLYVCIVFGLRLTKTSLTLINRTRLRTKSESDVSADYRPEIVPEEKHYCCYKCTHTPPFGMPIGHCAESSNNLMPRVAKLSAIFVTLKIFFERLYWFHYSESTVFSHTPTVHATTISRFW